MYARGTKNVSELKTTPIERSRVGPVIGALMLVVIHLGLSWWYGTLLPWGGDEWYTYDGRTLMAVPNTILIECARLILGEVSPENYMYYRLTGVVWTTLAICGFFLLGWSNRKYSFFVPVSLFLVLSPFVFYQEQYFRYYGYYLCASFAVFLLIAQYDHDYRRVRFLFWGLLLISPFLYLFLGFQIGCYVVWREWTCLSKKGRVAVAVVGLVAGAVVAVSWSWLIQTGMEVAFSGMSSMADNPVLRGLSPGLVIKPFYFVFESFWGYQVEPTESPLVMVAVIWLLGFLAIRFLVLCGRQRSWAILTAVCLLLPLVLIYLVLEPLTPPGATQLESKHALFGLPWLLLLAFGPSGQRGRWIGWVTVFGILGISLFYTFRRPAPAWPEVVDQAVAVTESGGMVILDGRSDRTFRFYAEGRVEPDALASIGELEAVASSPFSDSALMVVHNDWKAYQLLSLKQNWNSGSSSEAKVNAIAGVENLVHEKGFQGRWGFVRFPLQAFVYSQGFGLAGPVPSVLPIAYRDLDFPRVIDGMRYIGAARLSGGQSVVIHPSGEEGGRLVGFLKGAGRLPQGTVIGEAIGAAGLIPIAVGPELADAYESAFCRPFEKGDRVDGWRKRPLISQASRYPGSFFSAQGSIYELGFEANESIRVRIDHADIELVILIPEPRS